MSFKSYAALRAHRSLFLSHAVADVKKWCAPAGEIVEGRKPSDQHWLRKFGADIQSVNGEDARLFLITFMLIRASWETDSVATEIRSLASLPEFAPTADIPAFAKRLQSLNKRKARQTSAASKIATFVHPSSEVYIWDALATKSARLRARERGDEAGTDLDVYRNGKEHDYVAFHAACASAREDEKQQPDFQQAVADLLAYFAAQGCEMSNRNKVPDHFIERRLLDKLMFWEGWAVDRGQLPTFV